MVQAPEGHERDIQAMELELALRKDHRDFKLKLRDQRTALMAVVATAVLGVVGSVTTFFVASNQTDAQSTQSAIDFKREQQITAYSEFLTSTDDYAAVEGDYLLAIDRCRQGSSASELPRYVDLIGKYQSATQKNNVIHIVGSPDTRVAADQLMVYLGTLYNNTLIVCENLRKSPPDESVNDDVYGFRDDLYAKQNVFSEAARKDLNVE